MSKTTRKIYSFLREFKHNTLTALFGYSSACQQNPSCSAYTIAQIKKNGTIVGSLQGFWRSIHCRHF